jgi:hypothetical protein
VPAVDLAAMTHRACKTIGLAVAVALGVAMAAVLAGTQRAGASGMDLPRGREAVALDPAEFTTRIDNRYWPMRRGERWLYEGSGDGTKARSQVRVTGRTKRLANGVRARALRDAAREHGRLVEVAFEWYAQDEAGSVWYLAEDVMEPVRGKLRRVDGWEAGVDGAQPGVVMPDAPAVGMRFRQQHYARKNADRSKILSLEEPVMVPSGQFNDVLMLRETTPLEPRASEYKLYAPRVGLVLTQEVSGGSARLELARHVR